MNNDWSPKVTEHQNNAISKNVMLVLKEFLQFFLLPLCIWTRMSCLVMKQFAVSDIVTTKFAISRGRSMLPLSLCCFSVLKKRDEATPKNSSHNICFRLPFGSDNYFYCKTISYSPLPPSSVSCHLSVVDANLLLVDNNKYVLHLHIYLSCCPACTNILYPGFCSPEPAWIRGFSP